MNGAALASGMIALTAAQACAGAIVHPLAGSGAVGVRVGAARTACLGVARAVGYVRLSGLAPDLGRVGLVDQIGPALPVADEPSEQRRAEVTNSVHIRFDFRVVDEISDQSVLAGQASYRAGQSRRRPEQFAVQPVGTLRDVDVLPDVGGELYKRNVHAFRPARLAAGAGAANACSTALIDSSSTARRRRSSSKKARSGADEVGSIDASVKRMSLLRLCRLPRPEPAHPGCQSSSSARRPGNRSHSPMTAVSPTTLGGMLMSG